MGESYKFERTILWKGLYENQDLSEIRNLQQVNSKMEKESNTRPLSSNKAFPASSLEENVT